MSYHTDREENSDDAENNSAITSTGSKKAATEIIPDKDNRVFDISIN